MAQRKKRASQPKRQWRRVDLHIHTPASSDYQEPSVTYLDILQKAETRGVDILGFTDHNSVAGYARLQAEIEQLDLLESLQRILPEERKRLAEYRRFRQKKPGFPCFFFSSTLCFYIIVLFFTTAPHPAI